MEADDQVLTGGRFRMIFMSLKEDPGKREEAVMIEEVHLYAF